MRSRRATAADELRLRGYQLRVLRGARTRIDYCRELGIRLRTLVRYEAGERRILVPVMKLARILNVAFCKDCRERVHAALTDDAPDMSQPQETPSQRRQVK